MYFVLGLLTAGLLALTIAPAMWRRADRLAQARIQAALPMSLAEVQAEKDQLRAEFAVSARRLEMKVEQLEGGANGRLLEISRSRTEIARLEADRTAKAETIETLETRVSELVKDLDGAESNIAAAKVELAARDADLALRAGRITGLQAELGAAVLLSEEQKLELVARDTAMGNLNDSLADSRAAEARMGFARDGLADALEEEQAKLAAEKRRAEGLEGRITAFEAERVDRLATLERRAADIKALQAELAAERAQRESIAAEIAQLEAERTERLRELTRRSEEVERLKSELLAANEARLQAAANAVAATPAQGELLDGDNIRKAIAATEAEKDALAAQLSALEGDQAKLRVENAELRRIAGAEWETQRAADQRLRERLSEVASAVMRMTQPSEAGFAHRSAESGNGDAGKHPTPIAGKSTAEPPPRRETTDTPRPVEGRSLAERIRALQHAAARQ
jgi:DNA repair exonuclease SbcCD ATPase subunit